MNFTQAQQAAIEARGNVLVAAGAGTGKTRTLVERCLDCLLREQPPVSLDEILVVTFTEAAAAEMKQRIRARLAQELSRDPLNLRWQEQLAVFELANIGTLHSFCFRLVREHFYELQLDPQLSVLEPAEAHILAEETLDGIFQKYYGETGPEAEAVQRLVEEQSRGWDKPIRSLMRRLHEYAQTRADAEAWAQAQIKEYQSATPDLWQRWLLDGFSVCRERWGKVLAALPPDNQVAARCVGAFADATASPDRARMAAALAQIQEAFASVPRGKGKAWLDPVKGLQRDVGFLASLAVAEDTDPLQEDWQWVRQHMLTLLKLSREFTVAFSAAKRELGMLDFHDLEQHALTLLWDPQAQAPTAIAREWQEKFRFIFVDEYQDINAAQDRIIEALSGEGSRPNRFLVGDVKQSIYRFRLANPGIFQRYMQQWRTSAKVIPLLDNYRSREGVLDFVNALFAQIMGPGTGELVYDEEARLQFGARADRAQLASASGSRPCAELHLRITSRTEQGEPEENSAAADFRELEESEKEACLLATRLRQLRSEGFRVWDEEAREFRPVQWRDMAILLRSPSTKAESYARAFARLQIPLQVERGGFYQALEISDLLGVLQILDNPLQDVPLLAVLRSPLVGLDADELATIRTAVLKTNYWGALLQWSKAAKPAASGTEAKVTTFLERFSRWRKLARQVSLSRCLESVLAETHYGEWLLTQPRGAQRHANVQRLLLLAQQFDRFQRQGLFRFLRFIEAQQDSQAEPEAAPCPDSDSVRLLSIHQSKGLEFPVVAVADLAKPFNTMDLHDEIILDEHYGLCPQVKPPQTGRRYPSLPYWLARERQKRELLSEEQRLLYVALTRAKDHLILTATISESAYERLWVNQEPVTSQVRSFADWIGPWFASQTASTAGQRAGQTTLFTWNSYGTDEVFLTPAGDNEVAGFEAPPQPAEQWDMLKRRLAWTYPYPAATVLPAKYSVSALRRAAAEQDDAAAAGNFTGSGVETSAAKQPRAAPRRAKGVPKRTAAETGTAHHAFLEMVPLEQVGSVNSLKQEAERLLAAGSLAAEDFAVIDFAALAGFWNSETGRAIRQQRAAVRRELSFTAKFAPGELRDVTGMSIGPGLENEFVVVQGVVDLAVILPKEIWLLDFKTDEAKEAELAEKVRAYVPQLKLYGLALERIYRRQVTQRWLYFLARQQLVKVD